MIDNYSQPDHAHEKSRPQRRYSPVKQLVIVRLLEFIREPEVVFWVGIFPIAMVVALGLAFQNKPVERVVVDLIANGSDAQWAAEALAADPHFVVQQNDEEVARRRLRTGKTELVATVRLQHEGGSEIRVPEVEYLFDPTRSESVLARSAVDDAFQRAAGRMDVGTSSDHELNEPGGRYIDFLVPGLIGMGLMGGGLWGVGFVTVDMRIRKLLKRFLATPMKKSQFLGGIMISRLFLLVPEVVILLVFARLAFDVRVQGSLLDVFILVALGAFTFAGVGLLVASRASTIEAVSGLMNLVMFPMWLLSGIFFSPDRFPDAMQPFIQALPLTPLISMLRSVMLEGNSLISHPVELAILAAWGTITFVLALRWFRWT